MSGTNSTATTQSGMPISSLPAASEVAPSDGVFGVFGGDAKLADPKTLVAAGLPDDVVKTDDLDEALSSSALSQYTDQAAQHAADAKTGAAQSQTGAAAAAASAGQAAQTGVQVATIAESAKTNNDAAQQAVAGVTADANAAKVLLTAAMAGQAPLTYRGYWDASTNTPLLASSNGAEGDLYIVSVAGTTTLDGNAAWSVGDGAWFTRGRWVYFARAGWAAVAQSINALRSLNVGDTAIDDDDTVDGFAFADPNGVVVLMLDSEGNTRVSTMRLPSGATMSSLPGRSGFVIQGDAVVLHVEGQQTQVVEIGLPGGVTVGSDDDQSVGLRVRDWSGVDLAVIGKDSFAPYNAAIRKTRPTLWLDAAVNCQVDASGAVVRWLDASPETDGIGVATALTGSVKLVAGAINGRPALTFDGASTLKHNLFFAPGTVLAVYRTTSSQAAPTQSIIACDSATAGTASYALRGFSPMGVSGGYAKAQGYIRSLQDGTSLSALMSGCHQWWQILGCRTNGQTLTPSLSTYTGGHSVIVSPSTSGMAGAGKGGTIGADYTGLNGALANFMTGQISEIIVWDRALTQREYAAVTQALADKYDLAPPWGKYIWAAFQPNEHGGETGGVEGLVMLSSDDGVEWQHVPTDLVFDADHTMRDPSITYYNGQYIIACTAGSFNKGIQDEFTIYTSRDGRTWDYVCDVPCTLTNGKPAGAVWAPEFIVDPNDNSLHVFAHLSTGAGFQVFETHPTDGTLKNWTTTTLVTVTGQSNVIDSFPFWYVDRYVLFFKNQNSQTIGYAFSDTLLGPYTVEQSGDWAGWGSPEEGVCVLPLGVDNNSQHQFRLYLDANGSGIRYTDAVGQWPSVLNGPWSTLKPVQSAISPQHGTILKNPYPNTGV